MVLLTMTPAIVAGLQQLQGEKKSQPEAGHEMQQDPAHESKSPQASADEPSLSEPAIGKPISHGQIIDIWQQLRKPGDHSSSSSLEALLRGSQVYVPPPPPKPEPVRFPGRQPPTKHPPNMTLLDCRIQSPHGEAST